MTEDSDKLARLDERSKNTDRRITNLENEVKHARGFVWKALAAVIGMLAAQWAKIMGFWQ